MKNQKGTTLTEVLIVLTIFAIVSSSIMLSLNPNFVGNIKVNNFCLQIKSDLRYAQSMSISTGDAYVVGFGINNLGKKSYNVIKSYVFGKTPPVQEKQVYYPQGVEVSVKGTSGIYNQDYSKVVFNANGIPESGYTIRVSYKGVRLYVKIESVSGRVQIRNYD